MGEKQENEYQFLYRSLRPEEINAGNILIPKVQGVFFAEPRLGIDTRLPFVLGPTQEHAVRQHQWNQDGYSTSGVSTTPFLDRARYYAQKNKVIVKIDRNVLHLHGIKEFIVKNWLGKFPEDIAVPEDDEVILTKITGDPWPKEIIVDVIILGEGALL
ncbi:MAG: hypothetical protein ISS57_12575 [Anaerolineales bacterium]|nr:hypothetical protein [Anaerolineales bacterium]